MLVKPQASALTHLRSRRQPVVFQLSQSLSQLDSRAGQPINLLLMDHLLYKNRVLPAGSRFEAQVAEVSTSKTLNREGYFALQLTRFCEPARSASVQDCISLEADLLKPLGPKNQTPLVHLYRPEVQVLKNKNQILQTSKSLAITGLAFVNPIAGLAVGGVDGVTEEFLDDHQRQQSVVKKVGKGLWVSTGIPAVVRLFRPGKNPEFLPQQLVELTLPPKAWEKVFTLAAPLIQSPDVKKPGI